MSFVDHMEGHVRGISAVAQIPDPVTDEHVRVRVLGQRFAPSTFATCARQAVNEFGCRRESSMEAVLDRSVRYRNSEVRLAQIGRAAP